ncbi:MAG TPA: MBL fold metallo-hydrolase [Candidatus Binataceae bacterium]|nr:MBL fold metallo-hydrolase [Candidatus Binataceae bacterium]
MDSNRVRARRPGASVTMLGTGDAFASGGRGQAGFIIDAAGTRILMEAGPEILGALKRNAISPASLDLIVISHLHGDHFGGIPFLMLEYMWESRLARPITIVGPRRLEARCWRLLKTLFPGFDLGRIRRKLRFVVLAPGSSMSIGKVKLSAIRSPHTRPDISLSIRAEVGGKKIVFSGDTGWNDGLVKLADGADLFICECTYYESKHLRFHLNYPELARHRELFKVDRMLLTHIGREVLNHKREVKIELASDGMKFAV